MASVNKVIIVGRLGKDPELHQTERGGIASLSVATSETWKDKSSGERKEKTEWHRVTLFVEATARFAGKYAKKGTMVYVEGQLETREWTDKQGQKRYSTEITVKPYRGAFEILTGGSEREPGADDDDGEERFNRYSGDRGNVASPKEKAAATGQSFNKTMDDEIPF